MLTAIKISKGSERRFWSLSRLANKLKQLLNIFLDKTMIRETVAKILLIIYKENIFIETNEL